jgi:hypothetical protein
VPSCARAFMKRHWPSCATNASRAVRAARARSRSQGSLTRLRQKPPRAERALVLRSSHSLHGSIRRTVRVRRRLASWSALYPPAECWPLRRPQNVDIQVCTPSCSVSRGETISLQFSESERLKPAAACDAEPTTRVGFPGSDDLEGGGGRRRRLGVTRGNQDPQ